MGLKRGRKARKNLPDTEKNHKEEKGRSTSLWLFGTEVWCLLHGVVPNGSALFHLKSAAVQMFVSCQCGLCSALLSLAAICPGHVFPQLLSRGDPSQLTTFCQAIKNSSGHIGKKKVHNLSSVLPVGIG